MICFTVKLAFSFNTNTSKEMLFFQNNNMNIRGSKEIGDPNCAAVRHCLHAFGELSGWTV